MKTDNAGDTELDRGRRENNLQAGTRKQEINDLRTLVLATTGELGHLWLKTPESSHSCWSQRLPLAYHCPALGKLIWSGA